MTEEGNKAHTLIYFLGNIKFLDCIIGLLGNVSHIGPEKISPYLVTKPFY